MFDVQKVRQDFLILNTSYNDNPLIYFDNAATTQKPIQVINKIRDYYLHHNANVGRSSHFLAEQSLNIYEQTRSLVAQFINSETSKQIIFTKNSTEGLNLVAFGLGLQILSKNDVVLTFSSEHNSNIMPWKSVCSTTGALLKVINVDAYGELEQNWESYFTSGVKFVVFSHVSNVLGNIFDVKKICKLAKNAGAITVVDGSQAVSHLDINVLSLGCDFYSFSAHKMLGPMGVGVLWGKYDLLQKLQPFYLGGGTVTTSDYTNLREIPARFEYGTPNVGGISGFREAIKYINNIDKNTSYTHMQNLLKLTLEQLNQITDITILGTSNVSQRVPLISFTINNIHSHDISAVLNNKAICVRAGTHCAMNLHENLQIGASTRVSFYYYNTQQEVLKFVQVLKEAISILKKHE